MQAHSEIMRSRARKKQPLGHGLRRLRIARGETLQPAAEAIGVHTSTISKIERGGRPRLCTAILLARHLTGDGSLETLESLWPDMTRRWANGHGA